MARGEILRAAGRAAGLRPGASCAAGHDHHEPPHRRLAHAGQLIDLFLRQGRPARRPRLYQLHSTVEPAWMGVRQVGQARQPQQDLPAQPSAKGYS